MDITMNLNVFYKCLSFFLALICSCFYCCVFTLTHVAKDLKKCVTYLVLFVLLFFKLCVGNHYLVMCGICVSNPTSLSILFAEFVKNF